MSSRPRFARLVHTQAGTATTAETSLTAPTNAVEVWNAGAQGGLLHEVILAALGATTASMVHLYLHDGTNFHYINSIKTKTITPSGSIRAWRNQFRLTAPITMPMFAHGSGQEGEGYQSVDPMDGLILGANWALYIATHGGDDIKGVGMGTRFEALT